MGDARPEPTPNDPGRKVAKQRKALGVRVDFDPEALREFVTGAHHRNVLQRERSIKKAEKAAVEARKDKRRQRIRAERAARARLRAGGNPFMELSLPELRREALKAKLRDQLEAEAREAEAQAGAGGLGDVVASQGEAQNASQPSTSSPRNGSRRRRSGLSQKVGSVGAETVDKENPVSNRRSVEPSGAQEHDGHSSSQEDAEEGKLRDHRKSASRGKSHDQRRHHTHQTQEPGVIRREYASSSGRIVSTTEAF